MDAIYEVHGLTKRYGRTAALNGVDFAVTPGKLVGLLGPNGSGKTTLMKISAGLLQPTAGSVIIDKVPVGVFTKAVTSYLPDRMALPTEFTADDAVSLYADFFTDFDKVKANAMLADLHIGGRDKIDSMSKGTQEKMQLCLTMSRAAKLYLLDEPLGGVDPAARDYILSTILHNYSEDAALMLSTHLIGDIEKVLDEVILLQDGKVLRQTAVDELREETGGERGRLLPGGLQMLTNLLHYEFKSTGRVVLPIVAGVLVLNIFTNILSHFVQNTSDRLPLAGVAMALLALASAVSLLVVLAICFFIEIQQFYRLLGERGYLMLALPVPIWQHIAAKVICGTVWTLFGMVFFTLCGMLTTDTVSGSGFALDFSRVTAEDVAIWSAMLLIILALIAGALLHAYLACAFAAQFTQQRLLISIAAYFVIGFIGQMAALVTAVFVAFRGYKYLNNTNFSAASFFGPDNTLGVIVLTLLAVFALITLVDALLWALTQWLMTKRLNLA